MQVVGIGYSLVTGYFANRTRPLSFELYDKLDKQYKDKYGIAIKDTKLGLRAQATFSDIERIIRNC